MDGKEVGFTVRLFREGETYVAHVPKAADNIALQTPPAQPTSGSPQTSTSSRRSADPQYRRPRWRGGRKSFRPCGQSDCDHFCRCRPASRRRPRPTRHGRIGIMWTNPCGVAPTPFCDSPPTASVRLIKGEDRA